MKKRTTLCYIAQGDCYLMLHRVKKEQDENRDKWIGVGGKFLPGEANPGTGRDKSVLPGFFTNL